MFVVKKNSEMVNKTFRLPVDLVQRLTEVARAQDVSVNNLVQQCCEYALGDMGGVENMRQGK
ncbi:hypothetical protein FYJ78_12185 [Selenomonas sp. WCA-380-WT-3B 3/]|uniref:Toxin-antitoxin system HicB family antitoxin n=1 Tax=Selenomonas montiformis TaxID=2652285 RepID=A0A6I2V2L9_9FIRM|nr:hypothetical protein [Selenomonas montiformis]MDY4696750.1 hypothetical protein [Selenomonas montiformis]MSV25906.1 hypothetical protein [Selenomonas montiformis]